MYTLNYDKLFSKPEFFTYALVIICFNVKNGGATAVVTPPAIGEKNLGAIIDVTDIPVKNSFTTTLIRITLVLLQVCFQAMGSILFKKRDIKSIKNGQRL